MDSPGRPTVRGRAHRRCRHRDAPPGEHPLYTTFQFTYLVKSAQPVSSGLEYDQQIQPMGKFSTVGPSKGPASPWCRPPVLTAARLGTLDSPRGGPAQVEQFWQLYSFQKRPSELVGVDYHLFRDGIKPIWEVWTGATARPACVTHG